MQYIAVKAKTFRTISRYANDGTTVTQTLYTDCKQDADVMLYRINNGGRVWPGGWQYLPKILIGKTTQNINAIEISWEFFKKHPMN